MIIIQCGIHEQNNKNKIELVCLKVQSLIRSTDLGKAKQGKSTVLFVFVHLNNICTLDFQEITG